MAKDTMVCSIFSSNTRKLDFSNPDTGRFNRWLGPDGLASVTTRLSVRASRLQTGYLYHYAFVMLIGVVLLVSWYLLRQIGG
jgi:hypothetical protein